VVLAGGFDAGCGDGAAAADGDGAVDAGRLVDEDGAAGGAGEGAGDLDGRVEKRVETRTTGTGAPVRVDVVRDEEKRVHQAATACSVSMRRSASAAWAVTTPLPQIFEGVVAADAGDVGDPPVGPAEHPFDETR
jgi:hypothetical protein